MRCRCSPASTTGCRGCWRADSEAKAIDWNNGVMYALKSIGYERQRRGGDDTVGLAVTMASLEPACFRAQGWWRDEPLRDWLDRHRAGDRVVVRTFDDSLTYASFAARV